MKLPLKKMGGQLKHSMAAYQHTLNIRLQYLSLIHIQGIDKQLVGKIAAEIRSLKKPEPYKGKGIRYSNEQVRRKVGKSGAAVGGKK